MRSRNKAHLVFVAAQPCLVCQRSPCDAHHLKFAQPRSLGRKVSDEFTVPLCREHHNELHRHGNEMAWWANLQIAPLETARELWETTTLQADPTSDRKIASKPDAADDADMRSSNAIGALQPMTSFRQIEANRRNAIRSTGPRTEEGKRQTRRNAVRHGLCAETVIEIVEDIEDYRAFEAAVIADYDAQTAVERELVLRLASLLWRLRRATAIETDLLRIQAEILRERRDHTQCQPPQPMPFRVIETAVCDSSADGWNASERADHQVRAPFLITRDISSRDLAHCFQRLANLDAGVFERLGRYETTLWRQMVQIHFLLQAARRR